MIPFNKPSLVGNEKKYIEEVIGTQKFSGNGKFTKRCHAFFSEEYGFGKCLLTSSCTDALEMAALLCDIKPEDEVIMPSYTFVSTANAFVLRGARIRFADSDSFGPNMDMSEVRRLINPRTKAIVIVHYGGQSVNLEELRALCDQNNIFLVEDAAQAIDARFNGKPLGSFGHFSTFSFHETKNIISGEGGMLVVNDKAYYDRAEIIWEKGTNRAAFGRGEVKKYSWIDLGSSFLPSEITAAFLFGQLESLKKIQEKRENIWWKYHHAFEGLEKSEHLQRSKIYPNCTVNGHLYYLVCNSRDERESLIDHLKKEGVLSVFHYISLHKSPFFNDKYSGPELKWADYYTDHLLRLPLYYSLSSDEQDHIINSVKNYYA